MFLNLTQILIDDHSGWGPVGFILLFFLIIYLAFLIFTAVCYVMQSMGLYTLAKRRGIRKPWLAWLPVGNMWIWGSLSDQYRYVVKGEIKNKRKALIGLTLGIYGLTVISSVSNFFALGGLENGARLNLLFVGILMFVSLIALAVCTIAGIVIQYMALYDLYASCEPNNVVLYLLMSIFVSITMPFLLFACRNKDLGMPPRKQKELPKE